MCNAEFQIMDYTSSHVITISNGQSKVQDGTFRVVHPIDLNQYTQFLTETKSYIEQNIPRSNSLLPLLNEEINQTTELISVMLPIELRNNSYSKNLRKIRSINLIGTAWKYIAGSPDHDDFELLEFNLSNLNENNNKQVIINQIVNDRINNLTDIINNFSNTLRKDNNFVNEVVINLQNRVRLIKEQLININHAIQWAKNGIINPLILNRLELKMALEKLEEERMPFASAEEAVEYAQVSIMLKNSVILYIIKIPLTSEDIFENIKLYSVLRNKKGIKLLFKEIMKNKNTTYGLKTSCRKYNKIKLCKENDLVDLSKNDCIPNVIKGLASSCPFLTNPKTPQIEEIFPGVILLNDFRDTVEIDRIKQPLSGTFLIKFTNSTIVIQNNTYRNYEYSEIRTIPTLLQPTPVETRLENILTFETLQELHINNTHEIQTIKFGTIVNGVSSMLFFFLLAAAVFLILYLFKITKKTTVPNSYSPTPPAVILTNVQPTVSPSPPILRFNDIPYF